MTAAATLCVGDPPVAVTVRRSARARRFTLRLAAGTGAVCLTVPPRVPEREIRAFLLSHSDWIAERRATLPPVVLPAPGTVLTISGHAVTLERGAGRSICRRGDVLAVPGEGAGFRARLRGWLRETARTEAAARCDAHAERLGRSYGKLVLRDPRSRWGSCTARGDLMLSWRLILAPAAVLDYVAAHEVAHLAEMNHAPAYWRVLEGLLPGYRTPRDWLRAHGAELHRIEL